jgi:endoglucanase
MINDAVDTFAKLAPNAAVYLDGTHSAWLGVGEAAYRLVHAGVQRAQGFFLNVSNYQTTDQSSQFGTWVSTCIAAGTGGPAWMLDPTTGGPHFDYCPSQYNPATGYALDYSDAFRATVTAGLQGLLGDAVATTHFVVDTSRNGNGPWTTTATYPDAQVWCNPPGRGVGLRPTRSTGSPLLDAYLWVKTPGESDGSCNRGVAGSTTDPEWTGITDPIAGAWFPEQALQLASLANPKLF